MLRVTAKCVRKICILSLCYDCVVSQQPRALEKSREKVSLNLIVYLVNIKVLGSILCGFVETRNTGHAFVQYFLYEMINRSRAVGSVEIRWCLNDSSLPFGYADKVMVVSCSLIGVLVLSAMIERRVTPRCSRRDSLKYFLELTSEKLCPRPRELRSDDRRCCLRIFFTAQHNRYLVQIPNLFEGN